MSAIDQLLRLTTEYGRAASVETSVVSWRLFGDSKKLQAIIDGGDIQVRRMERALKWLADNWPESAVWPEGIAAPQASDAA